MVYVTPLSSRDNGIHTRKHISYIRSTLYTSILIQTVSACDRLVTHLAAIMPSNAPAAIIIIIIIINLNDKGNLQPFATKYSVAYQMSLTSPTSGGRSVGIVRWRTKAPEFLFKYQVSYFNINNCLYSVNCCHSIPLETVDIRDPARNTRSFSTFSCSSSWACF
jgi:hypothetical protein